MVKKWRWLALVIGIGLVVWWANFRSKGEIEYRLVSEIEGVEIEVDMDKFREYLVKLNLEIKPDFQLKLANKNGLNWRKVGKNIRLVELRIRDVGQLQDDVNGKEIVSRFGEARGGKEAVLVTYTWPVEKDGGKKVDFLVYVNTDWYMSESKRQIADKVFSSMILDNFDRGVRLGKEEIKNKIEDRLGGDFEGFVKITKKELGWRLVKPALGACSGVTICEQDVNVFRCQGGLNNGVQCSNNFDCTSGLCVWTEETYCGHGFAAGIPCVGSTYCAGDCPDGFSCDLGGCRQPPYVPPGDPTPTDSGPVPTQPPENCLTYGSYAGVVIYVYEDTNWSCPEKMDT